MDYVLDSEFELRNSSNELLNRYTINRHFSQLLANDLRLNELYENAATYGSGIRQFVEGTPYNKGDLIWIVMDRQNKPSEKSLYLLQSQVDNNTTTPFLSAVELNQYSFEPSGWKDKNEYTTIYETSLSAQIMQEFVQYIDTYHQFEENYHKYGTLPNDKKQIDSKLLKNDFSNVDVNRKQVFFPNKTIHLAKDNVILNGVGRIWDNGLLEYEILFKLAHAGIDTIDGVQYEVLSCNALNLKADKLAEAGLSSADNSPYFADEEAYSIFAKGGDKEIKLGSTIQKNRNDYANSYAGTIKFPVEFIDTNYMIFNSDVRSQERSVAHQTIDHGANTMVFVNKTTSSVTALYVLMPIDRVADGRKSGLVSNSFHCQVIGRWK